MIRVVSEVHLYLSIIAPASLYNLYFLEQDHFEIATGHCPWFWQLLFWAKSDVIAQSQCLILIAFDAIWDLLKASGSVFVLNGSQAIHSWRLFVVFRFYLPSRYLTSECLLSCTSQFLFLLHSIMTTSWAYPITDVCGWGMESVIIWL